MVTVNGNRAQFEFVCPQARNVFVAGDFNQWRTDTVPMRHVAPHLWRALLVLPPGEYHFRYFADGRWYTDYAAFGVEPGPLGVDSVLWIPVPTSTPRTRAAADQSQSSPPRPSGRRPARHRPAAT
ncbi:MAG: hypothetical protein BIFFINMI_01563 [Phycisphaerae bacterium]|nr:hypothetical protein [Phycisphaerae bacterium]